VFDTAVFHAAVTSNEVSYVSLGILLCTPRQPCCLAVVRSTIQQCCFGQSFWDHLIKAEQHPDYSGYEIYHSRRLPNYESPRVSNRVTSTRASTRVLNRRTLIQGTFFAFSDRLSCHQTLLLVFRYILQHTYGKTSNNTNIALTIGYPERSRAVGVAIRHRTVQWS